MKKFGYAKPRTPLAEIHTGQGPIVPVLQRILGHSKIETTMVYVHLSKQRIEEERQVINNLHRKMPFENYQKNSR